MRTLPDAPFCAEEEELAPPSDELPVHLPPEEPRERRGPFGISVVVHLLILIAVVLETRWAPALREAPAPGGLLFELREPVFEEPAAAKGEDSPQEPLPPEPKAPPPAPEVPRQNKPLTPPPVPAEIPPPAPLPPPTRMGELVPVPHLPAPGTVPPEEGKPGAPGPPAEAPPEKTNPGDASGTNIGDTGSGPTQGPGAGAPEEGRLPPRDGASDVEGSRTGSITVPRLRGSVPSLPGTEGGRRRKGLNLELPPNSGAFGDFSFDSKDYDWNDYHSQMYWSIWRAWHNRLYVMTSLFERWSVQHRTAQLKGSVLIRFVIERNGSVSSIEVLSPSSIEPLDESAQSALKEVILPRLPADFPREREGVTGRFSMEVGDVSSFKEGLRYMKYKGVF